MGYEFIQQKKKSFIVKYKVLIIILVLAISAIIFYNIEPEKKLPTKACFEGKNCITLELAVTEQEKKDGLMGRQELGDDKGMLFLYDGMDYKKFWMKNTLIPLDIIWLDNNSVILHIDRDVQPCESDPCSIYGPDFPTGNVIEVNSGFTDSKGINIRDRVIIT